MLLSRVRRFFRPSHTRSFVPAVRRTRLLAEKLEARDVPAAGLGIASDYSAFVLHDFNGQYSDAQGRVAVGGNATFTGYSVGDRLSNSNGTRDDLIVGGNLNYTNGQVFNGNTVYGNTVHTDMFGHPFGDIHKATPIDFGAAKTQLTNMSASWAAMPATGTVADHWGTFVLTGTNATQNVFTLTAAQLWNANNLIINAPAGSSVLVNVSGIDARMQFMGMSVNGTNRDHVVFNFHQARNLTIQGIGFEGSILAPAAFVQFWNGHITGTMVACTVTGTGEFEIANPNIHICVPCTAGATIKGHVYYDANDNGSIDNGEKGLGDVSVVLTGRDEMGNAVSITTKTDAGGGYNFTGLKTGTYTIRTWSPTGYHAGKSSAGSFGGYTHPNVICNVKVTGCDLADNYNFGELCGTM